MLGWILLGLLATAAVVVVISGILTKQRIKEQMIEQDMSDAIIRSINNCTNTVKLEDLVSGKKLEIQADGVSSELYQNEKIYV